jgi:hypothetical protein
MADSIQIDDYDDPSLDRYLEFTDDRLITPESLPASAITWKQYDFSKWDKEVFPLVRNDDTFSELVKNAVIQYIAFSSPGDASNANYPPDDWCIWSGTPPWQYTTSDYWCEEISNRAYAYLRSSAKLAKSLRAQIRKFPEWDNEESSRINAALETLFEPKQDSADYFRIMHACHWLSIPMTRAVQLLRPGNDIRFVNGQAHSCVVDLTEREVFDILWAEDWKQHSIAFALESENKIAA